MWRRLSREYCGAAQCTRTAPQHDVVLFAFRWIVAAVLTRRVAGIFARAIGDRLAGFV